MKLRFENKSIRFRIRKSELQQLKEHGFVKDEVSFPNAVLAYELRVTDIPEITPAFSDYTITIHIPIIKANHWFETDEVGIYHLINLDADEVLDIIIEKDFPCKDRPEEDRSDTFVELAENSGKNEVC